MHENQSETEVSPMKEFLQKYKHAWVMLYLLIYFPAFFWLENRHVHKYTVIQSSLDGYIPFMEIFIVPYFLWFAFVAIWVLYFFFTDKKGYYKLTAFLFTGMTIFLIWSWLFPNQLHLRPTTFERDNIFVTMVQFLYQIDTSTNVFPSIHVYNSLGIAIAVLDSEALKDRKGIRISTVLIAASIVLSTMFLKQHSILDVLWALPLSLLGYGLFFRDRCLKIRHAMRITSILTPLKGAGTAESQRACGKAPYKS